MNLQVGDYMEFIIGLLCGVVFLVLLGISAYVGFRFGRKVPSTTPKADNQEQRKQEELKVGFLELMNYDLEKALSRKKVD